MDKLTPFHIIDIYSDDVNWDENHNYIGPYTVEQIEAANFLQKMDWEGGLSELIGYGGWQFFPSELQELAKEYQAAQDALHTAITEWAEERGVSY